MIDLYGVIIKKMVLINAKPLIREMGLERRKGYLKNCKKIIDLYGVI